MTEFTTSVRNWLESSPDNVIAVHCKGSTMCFFPITTNINLLSRRERANRNHDLRLACGGGIVP